MSQRTIVIAVDGSENANDAVTWYIEQHLKEGDKVVLVTAIVPDNALPFLAPVGEAAAAAALADAARAMQKEAEQEGQRILAQLSRKFADLPVDCIGRVVSGDARHAIIEQVEQSQASLLVIGSRGRGAVARTLLGSVSDFCLHHVTVPVAVIRGDISKKN
ncbi:MAG: hypothetical protein MHM6MM_006652 [Cercozoa sp. M6MM]